jgi:hypothetical protein
MYELGLVGVEKGSSLALRLFRQTERHRPDHVKRSGRQSS